MEADFQAVYSLDLRAVLWGPNASGCRRVLALVEKLPADTATVRAVGERARAEAEEAARPKSVREAVLRFHGGEM